MTELDLLHKDEHGLTCIYKMNGNINMAKIYAKTQTGKNAKTKTNKWLERGLSSSEHTKTTLQ